MQSNPLIRVIAATILLGTAPITVESAANPPNIVVILTDDQGYAGISLNPHHPKEVSTPNMDALAADGVVFSQGYTSGHVCSPTRAGLMLGRYQQRVGVYSAGDGGRGFDPTRTDAFDAWIEPMADPITGGNRRWNAGAVDRERTEREQQRLRKREQRKRQRAAEKQGNAP